MRSRYPAPSPTHHSQSHRQRQPTTPSIPCTHPRPYTHMVLLAIVQVQREATTLPGCCTTNHRSPCMRRVVLLQDPSHVLTTVEVEPDTHTATAHALTTLCRPLTHTRPLYHRSTRTHTSLPHNATNPPHAQPLTHTPDAAQAHSSLLHFTHAHTHHRRPLPCPCPRPLPTTPMPPHTYHTAAASTFRPENGVGGLAPPAFK